MSSARGASFRIDPVVALRTWLWALVGFGAAAFVVDWLGWYELGAASPAAVAGGLLAFVLVLAVAAVEAARGLRLAALRWTIVAAGLLAVAASGTRFVATLATTLALLGLAAAVALVILRAAGLAPEKRRPLARDLLGGAKVAGLAFVLGGVAAIALLEAAGPDAEPRLVGPRTIAARRAQEPVGLGTALVRTRTAPIADAADPDASKPPALAMLIDADRQRTFVVFDHAAHVERNGGNLACGVCHHRNRPLDRGTGCSACHQSMSDVKTVFDHELHLARMGRTDSCAKCHEGEGHVRPASTKACDRCHPPSRAFRPTRTGIQVPVGSVPSYADAMHGLCVGCHMEQELKTQATQPHLTRCSNCHRQRAELLAYETKASQAADEGAGAVPSTASLR